MSFTEPMPSQRGHMPPMIVNERFNAFGLPFWTVT